MAFTLASIQQRVQDDAEEARNKQDAAWTEALLPISSQLHMIGGAKTLDEQKAGCQQLSSSILVVQMLHTDRELARNLDDLRVAIGQFAFMGREHE